MMQVLRRVDGQPNTLLLKCPGCKCFHQIWVGDGSGPRWQFNGDFEKPTFSPSLLITAERADPPVTSENLDEWRRNPWTQTKRVHICHSFIRNGQWEFLSDCTHHLAGQTVPLIPAE